MVVSIYKLDKIWNSTQSPAQPQSEQFRVVFELNKKTWHQNERKIHSRTSWSFKGYKEQLENIFRFLLATAKAANFTARLLRSWNVTSTSFHTCFSCRLRLRKRQEMKFSHTWWGPGYESGYQMSHSQTCQLSRFSQESPSFSSPRKSLLWPWSNFFSLISLLSWCQKGK